MSEMEKQAIVAKLVGLLRHPTDKISRKALENSFRMRKHEVINENLVKGLRKLKVDKAVERVSRHVFFPRKSMTSKVDPLKWAVPKITGSSAVNTIADNPEIIPMLGTPLIGGAIPLYMVAKSAIYKGLNIPTPSHLRHLRQRKKHMEIAVATGAGAGMAVGGVAGHTALSKKQRSRKARESRVRSRSKRAQMYKSAAAELQRMALGR